MAEEDEEEEFYDEQSAEQDESQKEHPWTRSAPGATAGDSSQDQSYSQDGMAEISHSQSSASQAPAIGQAEVDRSSSAERSLEDLTGRAAVSAARTWADEEASYSEDHDRSQEENAQSQGSDSQRSHSLPHSGDASDDAPVASPAARAVPGGAGIGPADEDQSYSQEDFAEEDADSPTKAAPGLTLGASGGLSSQEQSYSQDDFAAEDPDSPSAASPQQAAGRGILSGSSTMRSKKGRDEAAEDSGEADSYEDDTMPESPAAPSAPARKIGDAVDEPAADPYEDDSFQEEGSGTAAPSSPGPRGHEVEPTSDAYEDDTFLEEDSGPAAPSSPGPHGHEAEPAAAAYEDDSFPEEGTGPAAPSSPGPGGPEVEERQGDGGYEEDAKSAFASAFPSCTPPGSPLSATAAAGKVMALQVASAGPTTPAAARGKPLVVTIYGACGLRSCDAGEAGDNGNLDPYCVCELLGKPKSRMETSAVLDQDDLMWNVTGEVYGYEMGDALVFTVLDRGAARKQDSLGTATLAADLVAKGFEGELPLRGPGSSAMAVLGVKVAPLVGAQAAPEEHNGSHSKPAHTTPTHGTHGEQRDEEEEDAGMDGEEDTVLDDRTSATAQPARTGTHPWLDLEDSSDVEHPVRRPEDEEHIVIIEDVLDVPSAAQGASNGDDPRYVSSPLSAEEMVVDGQDSPHHGYGLSTPGGASSTSQSAKPSRHRRRIFRVPSTPESKFDRKAQQWDQRHHLCGVENELLPKQLRSYFSRPQSLPELQAALREKGERALLKQYQQPEVVASRHAYPITADADAPVIPHRHRLGGRMLDSDGGVMPWNDRWHTGIHLLNEGMHPLHRAGFSKKSVFEVSNTQRWRRLGDVEVAAGVWRPANRAPKRFPPLGV